MLVTVIPRILSEPINQPLLFHSGLVAGQNDQGVAESHQAHRLHYKLLSSRSFLSCGVPQGSALRPVLFLIYCADIVAIARRCGLGIHSYANDSQLYFHADPMAVDNKVKQLVACIEQISHWMGANRLNLTCLLYTSPSPRD